jgi:N-acetylglutamate synthase
MPSLTPRDVGTRVVVRYRLTPARQRTERGPADTAPPGAGPSATDVLGVLEGWDAGVLRLRRHDGSVVEVVESAVLAAKPVPARPVTRRDVRALEAAAALAWLADEEERLGGWLLRASGGFTGRANSCLPLGAPPVPLVEAVAEVEDWYDVRGLPPRFQVVEPLDAGLTAQLDTLGWERFNPVLVLTADLPELDLAIAEAVRPAAALPPVRVEPEPDTDWLDAYHYRGGALPPGARSVLVRGDAVGFAAVREPSGRTVAIARGAVTSAPDGVGWLGVTAVEVTPDRRRLGLGTHVLGGLTRWAADRGAARVYLQVAEENAAARATYGRLGLVDHHRYHYRRRP